MHKATATLLLPYPLPSLPSSLPPVLPFSPSFLFPLPRYDEELALADARDREVKMRGGQRGRGKSDQRKIPTWK